MSRAHPREGEIIAAAGNMPSPGHLYATQRPLSTANGGGAQGSVLHPLTHYQTKIGGAEATVDAFLSIAHVRSANGSMVAYFNQ